MSKTHRSMRPLILGALIGAATVSVFAEADTSQALLNLLVRKGIITQDEASQLKAEAAASAPAGTAPTSGGMGAPSSPAYGPGPGAAAGTTTPGAVTTGTEPGRSPLSFRIGAADFTPIGFMDFTTVYRSTNTNGAIGTGFNSIPYSNTSAGQISETKFSAQNSRLGLRVDSTVNDVKVLGYVETDFLGNAATTLNVSSNAATLRMRVYFADLKFGPLELMAGQDWSMLTPNRKGIGVMPSDVFYTMDMDTNYQAGLTWARQPQIRLLYHASDEVTFGLSAENPDNYTSGAVTYPTGFNTAEVDNNGNSPNAPSPVPDFIGKAALDTKIGDMPFHMELSGLLSTYKVNTYVAATGVNQNSTSEGGGFELAGNFTIVPDLTLVGTGFMSYGGGRYINGLGPDFIVTAPNASGAYGISPVKANSAILGAEWQALPQSMFFGYWSKTEFGKSVTTMANGTQFGYGYTGSANSNNGSIGEYTIGETQTLWKNPQYGALQIVSQFSYVDRKPLYVAPGAPSEAHLGMVYVDLRYVLP